MNYTAPFKYKLILSGPETNRRIASKLKDGKQVNFTSLLTENKRPKIYGIKINGTLVYIGYTSQSLSSRLNSGLKAKGKNGYHGYKWKNATEEVDLVVAVFDRKLIGDKVKDKEIIAFVEAIEAELVYRFRAENDHWPEFQNEIHFNNTQPDRVKAIAKNIYVYFTE